MFGWQGFCAGRDGLLEMTVRGLGAGARGRRVCRVGGRGWHQRESNGLYVYQPFASSEWRR